MLTREPACFPAPARGRNLRACFKIPWGPVFAEKAVWRGATKENILGGSSTEEQRSGSLFREPSGGGSLPAAGVARSLQPTAGCSDLAALAEQNPRRRTHAILKQALKVAATTLRVSELTALLRWRRRCVGHGAPYSSIRRDSWAAVIGRATLALRARPSAQLRKRLICSCIVLASGTVCPKATRTCSLASSCCE